MSGCTDSSELVFFETACGLLGGVSLATLRRWVAAGLLPTVKLGRRRLIERSAIEALIQRGRKAAEERPDSPPATV